MSPRKIRVYAPASISNLGPGFDVIGVAMHKPGDIVVAERVPAPGLLFRLTPGSSGVPADPKENVAGHVARLLLDEYKPPFGLRLTLHKRMPVGSGLGSSAASSVAAAFAVNMLLPRPLKKRDLLRFVVEGERKASGAPHADNAAPSLLGGVCLIRSYDPLDVVSLKAKDAIVWVVVHPHVEVSTRAARGILPGSIPLRSAVRQWGNVGALVAGIVAGDPALVGRSVEDVIVEPVRRSLIPGFDDVKAAALRAGALGCSISGSGPSVFAVAASERSARSIARAMAGAFRTAARIGSDTYISRINFEGAVLLPA
jgi:homoserine kinase